MRTFVAAILAVLVVGCSAGSPPTASAPAPTAVAPTAAPPTLAAPTALPPTAAPTAVLPTAVSATPTAASSASRAPRPTLPAGVLDPCTLLDPAVDLAALGGSKAPQHLSDPTDWGPECDYPTPAGVVQVVTFRPEVSDSVFESATNKVELSALGDLAFYDADWGRVRVRVGSSRFQVSCFCILPSGTSQATIVQLATLAAARLATTAAEPAAID